MENLALSYYSTPLGDVAVLASDDGLLLVHFSDRFDCKHNIELMTRGCYNLASTNEHIDSFNVELDRYFDGCLKSFSTPCVLVGTVFQKRTWQALERVPYGQTASYAQVAAAIQQPTAYRAVASANRANPFAIRMPCHRVIKSDGSLCGYNGGVHRKQWLLEHEKKYA